MQAGLDDISKQLMTMASKGELTLLKQCMADVQGGKYTPTDAAKILAGGIVEQQIDPFTGQPVKLVVDPTEKVI